MGVACRLRYIGLNACERIYQHNFLTHLRFRMMIGNIESGIARDSRVGAAGHGARYNSLPRHIAAETCKRRD